MNRRDAMRRISGAVSLGVFGACGATRANPSPTSGLGLVIYTLNIRRRALQVEDPRHDLFEPITFLEYCHGLGAGGIQVPLGVRDSQYASRLRDKAERYGMFIEGIASSPQRETDVQRFDAEMRTANQAGARVVRTVIIPGRRYERFTSLEEFHEFAERGKKALQRAAPVAERFQVRLAVENHKDQRVEQRLELLQRISSEFVGACVDTGNSFALLEDPLAVVQAYAPWAFSAHLKDQAVRPYQDGFLLADAVLGEGFLDLKEMVDVLRRAKPDIHFSLETITRDPLKVPCLAETYWPTFPDVPATDLARTLRTVRTHQAAHLPQISSLPPNEQAEVELANVKRCLDYAHRRLGL